MAIITLRVNVEQLKGLWERETCREFMLDVLGACGFDDEFIDDISGGLWSMRKGIIGKRLKKGEKGWEVIK